MYKNIFFDLDGTLINSIYDLHDSVNYILNKYGYKERSLEEINSFVGNGLKKLLLLSLPEKRDDFDLIYNDFSNYYFTHCCIKTKPYDGIIEVLKKLKSKGIKLAVITNKPQNAAQEICEEFFNGLFDVVTGEKEGIARKPEPEMVEITLKKLNAQKSETLYVGDSEVDILTGKNAGLKVLSVSYGFRDKTYLKSQGAGDIVDNTVDIYSFIVKIGG